MKNKFFSNGWVKAATLAITITALIIAGVKSYTTLSVQQEVGSQNRETLKTEGCLPARQNVTDIAVIKSKVEEINVTQKAMRKENKEAFREILSKLK